jgi:glycine/D-amino acid oxidase-like deaminating enzyme
VSSLRSAAERALADTQLLTFWLDSPLRPDPLPPVHGGLSADLLVVGGGYTGLWAALRAKERDPSTDVVLVEADRCGEAASGRNGGFCSSSLTHGVGNGMERWPDEMPLLEQLGLQNLDDIEQTLHRHGIDCGFERTAEVAVAVADHQVHWLAQELPVLQRLGHRATLLDREETRALVDSPTYLGGLRDETGTSLVDPARLAWGLRAACLQQGVRIHESTRVTSLRREGAGVEARTPGGQITARRAVVATNAQPLLKRTKAWVVPVYDHVLVTEPLSPDQRAAVGWAGREGLSDSGYQFHYYRLTSDNRILWGGYDAVYHFGSKIDPRFEDDLGLQAALAERFLTTFPALEGIRFSHRWAGVIDTCSRFSMFTGSAAGGRIAYAAGFTGLGVGASRFAADLMLDQLAKTSTERTGLAMASTKPVPFPPEPLRALVISLTVRSLARADRRGGRRNLWLRLLDRLGLGFDS